MTSSEGYKCLHCTTRLSLTPLTAQPTGSKPCIVDRMRPMSSEGDANQKDLAGSSDKKPFSSRPVMMDWAPVPAHPER